MEKAYKKIEAKKIFLKYFLIEVEKFEDVIKNDLDEWIYFFKNEEIPDDFKARNIDKAREKLKILKMAPKDRKRYERFLMNLASENDIIGAAREEGREEVRKKVEDEKKRADRYLAKLKSLGIDVE